MNSLSQRSLPVSRFSRITGYLVAAALIVWFGTTLIGFPTHRLFIATLLGSYAVLLYYKHYSWLYVLPFVTVSLDLTSYSGRPIFNELDFFFLLSISVALFKGQFEVRTLYRGLTLKLFSAYALFLFVSGQFWLLPHWSLQSLADNPYYLSIYGLKTIKGAFWAWLILPLWFYAWKRNRQGAELHMISGIAMASIVLFISILWERGTIATLLNSGLRDAFLSSFLNFSSAYRTTGIFSDMHTGGEVIDGIILLFLPVLLYGLTRPLPALNKTLVVAALSCLAYVALVGFTRATYISFFITCICVVAYLGWQKRSAKRTAQPKSLIIPGLVIVIGLGYFEVIGNRGFLVMTALLFGCFFYHVLSTHARFLPTALLNTFLPVGFGLVFCFVVYTHFTSPWQSPSTISMLTMLVIFVLSVPLFLRAGQQLAFIPMQKALPHGLVLLLMIFIVTQALGGYKINQRMDTVQQDLDTRFEHWDRVLQSGFHSTSSILFGNGVGSFPRNYLLAFPETITEIGSFHIESALGTGKKALVLGGGHDLSFGQRIPVEPDQLLTVQLDVMSPRPVRLEISLCERNMIFASDFSRNCSVITERIAPAEGNQSLSLELPTNNLGKFPAFARWPTVLTLKNKNEQAKLSLFSIKVLSPDQQQLISNPYFADNLDNWYFYNDFIHLPWHVKNTLLNLYYDYGLVGTALLFLVFFSALVKLCTSDPDGQLARFLMIGFVGFFAFGMFGSPLDSPRVDWLFHFSLLICALAAGGSHLENSA